MATINGTNGNDVLYGTTSNDLIQGFAGDDTLYGNGGNDTLYGGSGGDYIYAGMTTGNNTLKGGSGSDYINIFYSGSLLAGSLLASQFTLGTTATTDTQRFIFDNSTEALYFDFDGSGGTFSQVQIAQVYSGVTLSENNFVVV